ncbi:MAG: beta-lactamase family protein [Propionibacteriaceae bacterium]|nr:beta-lactamase family protein [Propionibacteriaceae bacterium]
MRKTVGGLLIAVVFVLGFAAPSYALPQDQKAAIQSLVDEASRVSGVPGISVSVIKDNQVSYFSSGYANQEESVPASENTLYELASVSKSLTGVGILLLAEQGRLSMNDSIDKYLPWFTLRYRGTPVDMSRLTLNHFLHHTSGLTNTMHFMLIPQGDSPDMLRKTVEAFVDANVAFPPGNHYEYGTMNYDILGLVIEVVSGQSYEAFMANSVFEPLGMNHTYVFKDDAVETGNMAQGYRSIFLSTKPYDAPDFAGNKPAGYIISSAADMARWMAVQLGEVEGLPGTLEAAITKSHAADTSVEPIYGMYYAAGWFVNPEKTLIQHGGDNPNFTTNVVLYPEEKVGIALLSNGANTNGDLALAIKEIVDGNMVQSYRMSSLQVLDLSLSATTVAMTLLAGFFIVLGARRMKKNERQPLTKEKMITIGLWGLVTVTSCVLLGVFPSFFGFNWAVAPIWLPPTNFSAVGSVVLVAASITWFVATPGKART